MTVQVIIVLALTFVIYVVGTLAYSVRIVGVKTGRIAIAFAVFNVFALCTELDFSRCVIFIVCGLIAGTLLAQLLLIPASKAIAIIARML